ncbi:hypothetical protein B0J17DRAFT_740406 [Rhizoctonia solani]|nr:hypothetical protein B0J17DRAFT_740406 [Rhizoctonia solani]
MHERHPATGLLELDTWSQNPDAPNIYWMSGMTGTGKTAIAYTFAEALKACKCRDMDRIVPTIASTCTLLDSLPVCLGPYIRKLPDIGNQTITNQFERLITEPLLDIMMAIPEGLVVIIYTLDECSNKKGVGLVLDVLLDATTRLPLKFFVTSRPESDIRRRVRSRNDQTRSVFVLHEIEKSLVQADIELYLQENSRLRLCLKLNWKH